MAAANSENTKLQQPNGQQAASNQNAETARKCSLCPPPVSADHNEGTTDFTHEEDAIIINVCLLCHNGYCDRHEGELEGICKSNHVSSWKRTEYEASPGSVRILREPSRRVERDG